MKYKFKIVPNGKGWWDVYRRPDCFIKWPMWTLVNSYYGKEKAITEVEAMKDDVAIYL